MVDVLKRALIPELLKYIARMRKALPGTVLSLIGQAQAYLPTTLDKVGALLARLYADLVGRITAWLPSVAPAATRLGEKLLNAAEAQTKKL